METVSLREVANPDILGKPVSEDVETFGALLELLDEAELRLTEAERRLAKVAAALRGDEGRAA